MKRNGLGWKIGLAFFVVVGLTALLLYERKQSSESLPSTAATSQASTTQLVPATSRANRVGAITNSSGGVKPLGFLWNQAGAAPAFARFADWSQKYAQAPTPAAKSLLEAEGIELARERRAALAALIQSDPERALGLAVPISVRRQLPQSITSLLEERVSGRGTLGVLGVLLDGRAERLEPSVIRNVTFPDRQYDAYVYGRRLEQSTLANLFLNGIAVGRRMAVSENPARLMEREEVAELNAIVGETLCSVSGEPSTINNEQTVLDVGGEANFFCINPHAQGYNDQLIAAEGLPSASGAEGNVSESHLGLGRKNIILIRVDFPDLVGAPFSDTVGLTLLTNLNNYYTDASYGIMTISAPDQGSDLTPTFRMANNAAYYGTNNYYDPLREEARDAADAAGYNRTNYHFHVICIGPVPGFGWGGLGYVHGTGAWIRNTSSTGTTAHEIGHNLGLNHANYWDTASQSVIGAGSSIEYGDNFDTMGGGGSSRPYNARYRVYLNWLTNSDWVTFSTNGVYRIMAYDVTNSFGPRAIRIIRSGGSNTNNYWLEFRQKTNSTRWQTNGAGLRWAGPGNQHALLLDTTPGSPYGKDDSPIVIGRTFSDKGMGLHITPLGKVGTVPPSLDIMLNRGSFVGNLPPTVTIAAPATNGTPNVPLGFTAAATDPNSGDALAYHWDFGDGNSGPNSAIATYAWPASGEFVVRCTVSDMKGGTASDSLVVRIGAPATFRISGTIRASDNSPVHDVRVYASSTRVTYTDSDGTYTLVGLPAGSYNLNASLENYSFTHPSFSNPVNVGPNASGIDFIGGPAGAEVLIPLVGSGAEWKYLDDGSNQGTNWVRTNFNDLTWNQGLAQLGYGDGDEATLVRSNRQDGTRIITTYFRHYFVINDPTEYATLTMGMMRDDGGVAYLNGREVFRSNMPDPPAVITNLTRSSGTIDAADESTFFEKNINATFLVPGTNVVAVEIHQANTTSSDVSFDLYLNALSITNLPRGCFLTSPSPNANFVTPTDIFLSANASAGSGGSIVAVEFFEGNNKLGEATARPYAMTWSNAPVGIYTLTARATDDNGMILTSAPVNITVSTVLFARSSFWKYLDNGSNQGTNWVSRTYNDSAWATGRARLGYGGDGEVTTVSYGGNTTNKHITTYFRRWFEAPSTLTISHLTFRLTRDDGAVVYVNGAEIYRSNMTNDGVITYTNLALATVNNADETTFFESSFPVALVPGTNLVAVEVHQILPDSSDLGFDLELLGSGALISPPALQISRSGENVQISWPSSASGWGLYFSSTVVPGSSWAPVSSAVVNTNGQSMVTVSPGGGSGFYRLQR